jgi:protein TonB
METFKGVEKAAVFEGGAKGYKKYLEQHLVPPNDIVKTGVVKAQFIVNKIGKVENVLLLRSLQLSADIEALRVLTELPDWTPAYQNGKNVTYQAVQYLTFQVR